MSTTDKPLPLGENTTLRRAVFLMSVLLVFGTVGVIFTNITSSMEGNIGLLYKQMIHARIPWLFVATLIAGAGLGVWSLVIKRRWYQWIVVPLELALAGFFTYYFLSMSFLPARELALEEGDPFPSYILPDQDGTLHGSEAGTGRQPALYIFYRGDW